MTKKEAYKKCIELVKQKMDELEEFRESPDGAFWKDKRHTWRKQGAGYWCNKIYCIILQEFQIESKMVIINERDRSIQYGRRK
jgi:hypothetical protein